MSNVSFCSLTCHSQNHYDKWTACLYLISTLGNCNHLKIIFCLIFLHCCSNWTNMRLIVLAFTCLSWALCCCLFALEEFRAARGGCCCCSSARWTHGATCSWLAVCFSCWSFFWGELVALSSVASSLILILFAFGCLSDTVPSSCGW